MNDLEKKLQDFRKCLGYTYPPTVKKLCSDLTGLDPKVTKLNDIIAEACPLVFDFTYPIYAESHREYLQKKILKHYFFREISCEDVDEWTLRLDAKMNEIMPYYNKMYESVGYLEDILDDVDYTKEVQEVTADIGMEKTKSTQDTKNKSQSSGVTSSKNKDEGTSFALNADSDTPQGNLQGLLDNTYLSSASKVDGTTTNESTGSSSRANQSDGSSSTEGTFDTNSNKTGNRKYLEKMKGKMYGTTKAKMVMEYRKAILNIDAEIINRLGDLFMLTYHPYYDESEDDEA